MRAVVLREFGSPASLTVEDVPDPKAGPGEVLIDVEACGVNFPDLLVVQGKYQTLAEPPFSPGKEVAGRVAAVGDGVTSPQPGERVMAQLEYGGYSEQVVVPAGTCCPIPDEVPSPDAAALGLVYLTAHLGLMRRAHLQPGEWVLVTGAGGGIGSAGVQLARALGGRAIAVGETEEQRALALEQGAEHAFDADPEALRDRVREATDGHGADVVLEAVGGSLFAACVRCIAWEGRIVVIGFAGGEIPRIHAGHVLVKNMAVLGLQSSDYFSRDPEGVRATQEELLALYRDGAIRAEVAATHPLEQAANALLAFEQGQMRGKLVLTTGRA
ncbi:MAG TPA: NADPH:quinone oxidoreductase family protein [Solirubrobacterales bacterium]|nr:NADPH:quinone oxidoreductase family protein [Solirubrobacterales bacterium]